MKSYRGHPWYKNIYWKSPLSNGNRDSPAPPNSYSHTHKNLKVCLCLSDNPQGPWSPSFPLPFTSLQGLWSFCLLRMTWLHRTVREVVLGCLALSTACVPFLCSKQKSSNHSLSSHLTNSSSSCGPALIRAHLPPISPDLSKQFQPHSCSWADSASSSPSLWTLPWTDFVPGNPFTANF